MDDMDDMDDENQAPNISEALDIDAVVYLMGTASGRRIAWKMLESSGMFRLSYSGSPYETAFREGRRSVGLELVALIATHMPHKYADMLMENATHG